MVMEIVIRLLSDTLEARSVCNTCVHFHPYILVSTETSRISSCWRINIFSELSVAAYCLHGAQCRCQAIWKLNACFVCLEVTFLLPQFVITSFLPVIVRIFQCYGNTDCNISIRALVCYCPESSRQHGNTELLPEVQFERCSYSHNSTFSSIGYITFVGFILSVYLGKEYKITV
jgi:hypothetical protein